ncbi:Hect domain-containing protein [Thraustotheca clavata]|uniref:HECT-type E3 ubiquitin transferase n=1 Tax=Thraustotheca clavata TaxID=74557 RepID=A0A1V9ZWZ4_9STRA|nr:Hect domain-containing protein [Thraustotheca clavata]
MVFLQDLHNDYPLNLACRGLNPCLFHLLIDSQQHTPLPYGSLLIQVLQHADIDPVKIIKKVPKDIPLESINLLEKINLVEDRVFPVVQCLVERCERGQRDDEEMWKSKNSCGQIALHLAVAQLLPRISTYLLNHSFNPSIPDVKAMTPVQVLERTTLDTQTALLKRTWSNPRKKPKNNDQLPYAFQKVFFAPVIEILAAFGEVVGFEKLFSHYGAHVIKSRWLKNLLLASLGFSSIFQKMMVRTIENGRQRAVLPYLAHIAGLFRLMKQSVSPNQRIALSSWNDAFTEVDSSQVPHLLSLILHKDTSANISTAWTYILLEIFTTGALPWHHLSFYHDLMHSIITSAKSIVFQLETDSYEHEEEQQILLILVRFEMLLVFGLLTKYDSLRDVLAPFKELVQLLSIVLPVILHTQDNPERFIACIYLIQVGYQMDDCLASTEVMENILNMIRQQISRPNQQSTPWKDVSRQSPSVPVLLRNLSQQLSLPAVFLEWMQQFQVPVNLLLRSEPRNLRIYLHPTLLELPGFIDLQVKIAYFGAIAEDRGTQLTLQVNRHAPSSLFVEFVIQQIVSSPARNLGGDIEVSFMHEPGAGIGPLREFFEMVRQYFFNPLHRFEHENEIGMTNAAHSIGLSWLNMARKESKTEEPRQPTSTLTSYFPIVSYATTSHTILRITPRTIRLNSPPEKREDGVVYVKYEQMEKWDPQSDLAKLYLSMGRLLGLSLRHSMVVGARFPLVFWQSLLSVENIDWKSYCSYDPVVTSSLESTLVHNFDVNSTLDFVFEACGLVEYNDKIWSAQIELEPNGFDSPVNNANKARYVSLLAKRHFCPFPEIIDCIRTGFLDVLPRRDLSLLRPEDVQVLVSGPTKVDVDDLKAHVEYGRSCSAVHPTIVQFWSIVYRLPPLQLEKLLVFWSGSALPPMFGFGNAHSDQVAWSIEVTSGSRNAGRSSLPQAHTCDRKLVLPQYSSEVEMEVKLLLALEYGSFGYDRL